MAEAPAAAVVPLARSETIVLASGTAVYDGPNSCFFILTAVEGVPARTRMVACGTATPALHGCIAVGDDPMVAGLSDEGEVWVLVVNVAVPGVSHVHYTFAGCTLVRLVAARDHSIVATTSSGLVVVLNTIHFTCTAVARVDPALATVVSGGFAAHEPGTVVLLGNAGYCVVVNGVGVLPAARIASLDPPTFDPYLCASALVDVSTHGLTVIAAGKDVSTFVDISYSAALKQPGASRLAMQFGVSASGISDPITQVCCSSANRLVAATRSGRLMIVVPEERGVHRTKKVGDQLWADVRTGADGKMWAVCRDSATLRLEPPRELTIS
jgi:hypothetical protein